MFFFKGFGILLREADPIGGDLAPSLGGGRKTISQTKISE